MIVTSILFVMCDVLMLYLGHICVQYSIVFVIIAVLLVRVEQNCTTQFHVFEF